MKHTPGPWLWEKKKKWIRLYTPRNGSCTVMDFVRRGMQDAQPRFSDRGDQPLGGIMIGADDLDLGLHPDARLIAAAPDLLAALQDLLSAFEYIKGNFSELGRYADEEIQNAKAAIEKALIP